MRVRVCVCVRVRKDRVNRNHLVDEEKLIKIFVDIPRRIWQIRKCLKEFARNSKPNRGRGLRQPEPRVRLATVQAERREQICSVGTSVEKRH